tara:strand:+ start:189 stop:494 length:306 start_codon:yes stop_codon:yes gene_type:complete
MMKTLTLAAAFWAAFLMTPAQAMMCFDPIDGRANFYKEFGEKEVGKGTLGNDLENGMLLLANPKTGTWTVMIVRFKDGFLCPFASGKNFELIKPKVKGQQI